jgi:hypothetical protein
MLRAPIVAAAAVLAIGSLLPTAAMAVVGSGMPAAVMVGSTSNVIEKIGCYRLGFTGYHWYGFCAGPRFLYPHRRICRHRYCYYR